ncbi:MAG: hypothetical protein JWM40_2572 [Frankiales bacterium]|nr:hypothetical protein [Frankiales bacterium]
MELFDLPAPAPQSRLDEDTHVAVFGDLPSTLAASLHTADVADLVLQLLDRGWRAGQISSRIGVMPAGTDPTADVVALLRGFLDQVPPDARWREERAQRAIAASSVRAEEPASEQSRQRWLGEIRSQLGTPRAPRVQPLLRIKPPCSLCGAESEFFVTRAVRLCEACVELLESGQATIPEAG